MGAREVEGEVERRKWHGGGKRSERKERERPENMTAAWSMLVIIF